MASVKSEFKKQTAHNQVICLKKADYWAFLMESHEVNVFPYGRSDVDIVPTADGVKAHLLKLLGIL